MKKKISLLLLVAMILSSFATASAVGGTVSDGSLKVDNAEGLDPGTYNFEVSTGDGEFLGIHQITVKEDGTVEDNSFALGPVTSGDIKFEIDGNSSGSIPVNPGENPPVKPPVDPDPVEPTDRPTNPTTPSDDDDDDDDSSGGGGGGSSSTTVKNPNPTKYVKRDEKQTPTQNTTPNTAWTSTGSGPMVFFDVQTTDWFYNAVNYVTQNGMMVGSNGKFNPNDRLTRGMMAQILYNIEKTPAAGTASFPDVQSTDWFASACAWANASGYMTGYSNGNFGPNDPITREQLAAILYRYSGAKGYNTSATAELSGFADGGSTSAWASTSMRWAVTTGLLSGKTGNRLDPTGTATRAEVAQILMNFGTKIAQ